MITLRLLPALLATAMLTVGGTALAERPAAPELLPQDTVVFVSIPDSYEFVERFKDTGGWQMLQDPQMRPLAEQLYSSLAALVPQVQEEVGLSIDDMLRLPQGEMTLALVPPSSGTLGFVVFFDAGDQAFNMQKLLDRGVEAIKEQGAVEGSETVGDVTMKTYDIEGNRDRRVMYFEREGTFVLGNNDEVMKFVIDAWKGDVEETLADNQSYAAIMQRCGGAEGGEPQFKWFVDPINTFKAATRGTNAGLGAALLPVLGLDAIEGLGGSVSMATENFDLLVHAHLLIAPPRAGVVAMLAMVPGEIKPEPWVPAEVTSYTTFHWDFETTYRELAALVDGFQGEGALANQAQRAFDNVGINFEEELLPYMGGRVTLFNWNEPPPRVTSNSNLLGVQMTDIEKFEPVFDRVVERFGDRLEKKTYGSQTYYRVLVPGGQELPADDENQPGPNRAQPQPCFCLLGDYVLLADRPGTLEKAILTTSSPDLGLASTLDYKLIASKVRREAGSTQPALMTFNRPEESLKFVYELINSEELRTQARDRLGENPAFQAVDQALADNPLPPFAVLKQYIAPGGALMTDDQTGFHYMSFTLRRKLD